MCTRHLTADAASYAHLADLEGRLRPRAVVIVGVADNPRFPRNMTVFDHADDKFVCDGVNGEGARCVPVLNDESSHRANRLDG